MIYGLASTERNTSGSVAANGGAGADAQTTPATEVADPFEGQPMTAERARLIGANEMGYILVVVYNNISPSAGGADTRTPDELRDDLSLLWSKGFYPINISDLATGDIDIPAGKFPVAITFDGSSPGQYRVLDDGTLDGACALGIMEDLSDKGYWFPRATFFCLTDVVPRENRLFGQSERYQEKLRNLTDWGYEVGSNTMTGVNLATASEDTIRQELAGSQAKLRELIGSDYAATSLAVSNGRYPDATSLVASGTWQTFTYEYTAVVSLEEAFCPSPFSTVFDPVRIPRITSAGDNLSAAIEELLANRSVLYISDGDPVTMSAPADLPAALGQPVTGLGRPIIRY